MKLFKVTLLSLIAVGLVFSFAFAAGDMTKGKLCLTIQSWLVVQRGNHVIHVIRMGRV